MGTPLLVIMFTCVCSGPLRICRHAIRTYVNCLVLLEVLFYFFKLYANMRIYITTCYKSIDQLIIEQQVFESFLLLKFVGLHWKRTRVKVS